MCFWVQVSDQYSSDTGASFCGMCFWIQVSADTDASFCRMCFWIQVVSIVSVIARILLPPCDVILYSTSGSQTHCQTAMHLGHAAKPCARKKTIDVACHYSVATCRKVQGSTRDEESDWNKVCLKEGDICAGQKKKHHLNLSA